MNYLLIVQYLQDKGYDASLTCIAHADAIHVKFYVNEIPISLFHFVIEDKIHEPPSFLLKDPKKYHRLAHTQVLKDIDNIEDIDFAAICVNVPGSTSINYECPELVFEESLRRHINLISKELTDLEWNESELIREFLPNWYHIFKRDNPSILLISDSNELQEAKLFFSLKKQNIGLSSEIFAVASHSSSNSKFSYICSQLKKRKNDNNQVAYIIPLDKMSSAPWSLDSLGEWYIKLVESLSLDIKKQFLHMVAQKKGKAFWLIFNGYTPSGLTWFGIRFINNSAGKKTIPLTIEKLINWKLTPVDVVPFTKDRLMYRSGANQKLQDKKVLLVGCGSVGSEIADKLGSAGVGQLFLSDPDVFSADNIHRHILSLDYSNFYKTTGLKYHLENKYPWMSVTSFIGKLRDWLKLELLTGFDIIIVAIGSPTAERIFHDYIYDNKISAPVINCWVEGYGVGGHATLDILDSQGCLRCAYIDNTNCAHGLASNLNFIQPNQDVTKNLAGCGSAFLPYGYMASTQTALITTDLAVKYLLGDINRSVKVSWKGSATEALNNGINLTDRYYAFNESLEITPLYNNICDICNE